MNFDKKLISQFINITSSAAIACHKYIGNNDKVIADKAATDAMRTSLNKLDIDLNLRPHNLSQDVYYKLTEEYEKL